MRIKSKNPLRVHPNEAAGLIPEAAPTAPTLDPYRLVAALGGPAAPPAVFIATSAPLAPAKPVQPLLPLELPLLAPPGLLAGQQSTAGAAAAAAAAQHRPPPGSTATIATARPVRKRKLTTYSDDMIPTDALLGRSTRPRGAPGPMPPLPPLPPHQPADLTAPNAAAAAAAAAAVAAMAATLPPGIQLVTMPRPGGGTMPGLALSAATLMSMPALLHHQQQLLRAQSAAAAAAAKVPLAAAGQLHRAPAVALNASPFRLVPTQEPAPTSSSSKASALPAVQVAKPRDIVQLAKQLDEEDRRQVLAASDARVVLRVLPGAQAASKGSLRSVSKPPSSKGAARGQAEGATGRGRGRIGSGAGGGCVSRRPTPEALERRQDLLPPGTWHPGFEAFGGITHVNVLASASAPPLAAAVAGTPPRLSQPTAHDPQFEFSEDPLLASLDYLHDAARRAGRLPHYSGAVQAAVSAEERLYKERLARAHFARDRRRFGKERVEGVRKSVRMRAAPEAFLPLELHMEQQLQQEYQRGVGGSSAGAGSARQRSRQPARADARPEDETDVRLGADFQAELPAVRPRPAAPSEDEARWTARLACQAGTVAPPQYDAQQTAAMPAASGEKRAAWVAGAHVSMLAALGEQRAAALGLVSMGATACSGLLIDAEEAALDEGMREFGRAFHTIQAERVPTRSVFDLQNFYYNVWKLRATPRSRAWYAERAQQAAQRQAEQERLEAAAVAEQEAQRQRQEARYKRRMLREVVQWVKTAARAPVEAQNRPTVMQRAQRAAKLVGSLNAA